MWLDLSSSLLPSLKHADKLLLATGFTARSTLAQQSEALMLHAALRPWEAIIRLHASGPTLATAARICLQGGEPVPCNGIWSCHFVTDVNMKSRFCLTRGR